MRELRFYCDCGWYGEIDELDALGSENGCCPDCGNEHLEESFVEIEEWE